MTVSRGIPVGPHGAHLLAELSLRHIDEMFANRGWEYIRFVDDFHIFCKSKDQAHEILYELAHSLDLVKLHLNRTKTRVVESAAWSAEVDLALVDRPINEEEAEILTEMTAAFGDPYVLMGVHELSAELRELLTPKRITTIFDAYLNAVQPDYVRFRWLLRRLAQTGNSCAAPYIADNFARLSPAATEAVRYLRSSINDYAGDHAELGDKLLLSLRVPVVAANPYLKLTVLSLFANVATLNHVPRLTESFAGLPADAQREVILAATTARAAGWLRTHKGLNHNDPWLRRAILYGSSTWTADEREHWSKTLKGSYEFVDDLIVESLRSSKAARALVKRATRKNKRL